nr:hypothetical protein BaRGS_026129 [Batillaria attramentaria]
MFVVPKPGGGWRPIIDLSRLNLQIVAPSFSMETARALRQSILPGEFAVSLDLTDAYLHVPMHRSAQKFLRFAIDGTVYAFRAMPFGLNISPWAFTRIMDSVMSTVRRLTTSGLSNYLDDILQKNLSAQVLQRVLVTLRDTLSQLGWLINQKKSDLIPSQRFEHLGMLFWTDIPLVKLTEKRLNKLERLLHINLLELKAASYALSFWRQRLQGRTVMLLSDNTTVIAYIRNQDLFATRFNAKLARFVSPIPDPQALALDALAFDWTAQDLYAFPPFPLVAKVLNRLRSLQCEMTLIVPLRWRVFADYCSARQLDPLSLSIPQLADFFLYLFTERHLRPVTIKGYRSCIARIYRLKGLQDPGSNPRLSSLLNNFDIERPRVSSLLPKWSLPLVLKFLDSSEFEPLEEVSLDCLLEKTIFLVTLATCARISEIHALSARPDCLRWNDDGSLSLLTCPGFISKNRLPDWGNQAFTLVPLPDDKSCPVRALRVYLARTSDCRKDTHEIRAMTASKMFYRGVSLADLTKAVGWSQQTTFGRFYLRLPDRPMPEDQHAAPAVQVELPYYSKYLLVAAYLASYNPVVSDKRFFCKHYCLEFILWTIVVFNYFSKK